MCKLGRKPLAALLTLALLVSLLPLGAAPAQAEETTNADTGVFTVEGGKLGTDYAYEAPSEYDSNGGDTLTIKSSTPLTISTNSESGTTSGCRIVIEDNVTANITLAGVKIAPANVETGDGPRGINLGSGATLNLTLSDNSANEIRGGTSSTGLPAPGIHVPENATLTIKGNGSLTVTGAAGDHNSAVGIGGKMNDAGDGESCGNVIIFGGTITVHGGNQLIAKRLLILVEVLLPMEMVEMGEPS